MPNHTRRRLQRTLADAGLSPSSPLPVRTLTAADSEALAQLMLAAYRGTVDFDGSATLSDARDELAAY